MQLKGIFIIQGIIWYRSVLVFGSAAETNANCINTGEDSEAESNLMNLTVIFLMYDRLGNL